MSCPSEETLAAFVEGELSAGEGAELERHVDGCEPCRVLLSGLARGGALVVAGDSSALDDTVRRPESAPLTISTESGRKGTLVPLCEPEPLVRGTTVGRYVILGPIGSGGMGVVYAAYDPELDRKIALKVLRPRSSAAESLDTQAARLLREAQAMARLSHPNVVTVHDVGTFEGQVFVAMEFVNGSTLNAWVREKRRSWREILAVFTAAGRGLAAAHAAGLVHRDFKPDNVMVGRDGAVRVTDFGLAQTEGVAEVARDAERSDEERPSVPPVPVTRSGAIAGTPAFMSPEQHLGRPTDARTDQFSFSVALYEALYGERPFGGADAGEIRQAVIAGRIRPPPKDAKVPARLRRVILRALQRAPAERYPSMDAYLTALAREPSLPLRRAAGAIGLTLAIAAGALGYRTVREHQPLCSGAERKLAGVWDAERKDAVHRAFQRTKKPYAEFSYRRVESLLDAYTARWVAAHVDACEATRVRGEATEGVLDRRMRCLEHRLLEVRGLTAIFEKADVELVGRAVQAAHALTGIDACLAATAQAAQPELPQDPSMRAVVDALRIDLSEAAALGLSGRLADAHAIAARTSTRAARLGYRPLEAESFLVQGDIERRLGRHDTAERSLEQAILAAEAGRQDALAARGWIELVAVLGAGLGQPDRAERASRHAVAAIERLGRDDELTARLLDHLGEVLRIEGRFEEAAERHRRALALREAVRAEHPVEAGESLEHLSLALAGLGRYAEAAAAAERAAAQLEAALGPDHPKVARALETLGAALEGMGKREEAQEAARRSQAIRARALAAGP